MVRGRRILEGRRRQRRGPFDLVFDDFAYPDGSLIGHVAPTGQTWAAVPATSPSLVVAHALQQGASDEGDAEIAGVITAPQLAADWWLRVLFIPTVQEADVKAVGWWWFDGGGSQYGLQYFDQGTGSGPPMLQAGTNPVQAIQVPMPAVDPSLPHELVMQWRAGGGVSLIFDDVVVGSGSDSLGVSGTSAVAVYQPNGVVTSFPRVLEVAAGLGVYSG